MGVFDGALTFTRFRVAGRPPRGFREKYLAAIGKRAFRPLEPESEDLERAGWCVAGRVLETRFDYDALYLGSWLVLGLRVDRWRIPKSLVRAHVAEEARGAIAKAKSGKLPKAQHKEIEARVIARLKKKLLPGTRLTDLAWNVDEGLLRVGSRSPRTLETVRDLFERTFEFDLVADSPWVIACDSLGEKAQKALALVEPTTFASEHREIDP